jgi:hypothetical protein
MSKLVRSQPRRTPRRHSENFTVGRSRFARISAVEGIALSDDMRAMLSSFDEESLSAEERRAAIIRRFAPAR